VNATTSRGKFSNSGIIDQVPEVLILSLRGRTNIRGNADMSTGANFQNGTTRGTGLRTFCAKTKQE
jgi:hypothetical protein